MGLPKFDFDFSFLDLDELRSRCINTEEIKSVFYGTSTFYDYFGEQDDFHYMIGYSLKNKFISFTFELRGDIVRLISVYLSYESEIKRRYFGI